MKTLLPIDLKFDDPTVVYLHNNPIRSKIFNFNKFIHNLDVKFFHQNHFILVRNCEGSDYIDKDHKHIVIGVLKILKNN